MVATAKTGTDVAMDFGSGSAIRVDQIQASDGTVLLDTSARGAALTAQLTTITPADAAGTPDYAIQAITNSSPYGFVNAQECISLLYVVQNLQTRLAEVEARLETAGIITAN